MAIPPGLELPQIVSHQVLADFHDPVVTTSLTQLLQQLLKTKQRCAPCNALQFNP